MIIIIQENIKGEITRYTLDTEENVRKAGNLIGTYIAKNIPFNVTFM